MVQNLNENQIRNIVRSEISRSDSKSRFGVNSIPNHTHDGIDSLPIKEDNIVLTSKLAGLLVELESGSRHFIVKNAPNVSRISFHGFAASTEYSPSVFKASITGEIVFGVCSSIIGESNYINTIPLPPIATDPTNSGNTRAFVQACTYTYLNTLSVDNSRVGTAPFLAYAESETRVVATLDLKSYTNDTLDFLITLADPWILQGNIIIE